MDLKYYRAVVGERAPDKIIFPICPPNNSRRYLRELRNVRIERYTHRSEPPTLQAYYDELQPLWWWRRLFLWWSNLPDTLSIRLRSMRSKDLFEDFSVHPRHVPVVDSWTHPLWTDQRVCFLHLWHTTASLSVA
jgi:hypothetical protein